MYPKKASLWALFWAVAELFLPSEEVEERKLA